MIKRNQLKTAVPALLIILLAACDSKKSSTPDNKLDSSLSRETHGELRTDSITGNSSGDADSAKSKSRNSGNADPSGHMNSNSNAPKR